MSELAVPSPLTATWTIAGLTWRRLVRGRSLWISASIALLPVVLAAARTQIGFPLGRDELFVFELLVLCLLAPMFVASSIGEDIEDRTTTYLWSRPVPRWAVIAGKLCALVPITCALIVGSWVVGVQVGGHGMPPALSVVALGMGSLAISLVAAGIATLVPKHGMALTIAYLLVDLPLGVLPASLKELSITHQIRALSDLWTVGRGTPTSGAIAIVVIGGLWAAIAGWRIRRAEA